MRLKSVIRSNLKNIPGKRIRKKLVVIECDDWGGIRMPSEQVCKVLIDRGLVGENDRFNLDTIECSQDLEELFDVLRSVKDRRGNHAVMTPITNVTNPDFAKIRESEFSRYHYEPYSDTLQRYGRGGDVLKLWKQGIEEGLFVPELHGREHVSVQSWLQALRSQNAELMFAFDHEFVFVELPDVHPDARGFRAEFFFDQESQLPFLKNSIVESVSLFTDLFGYEPHVFVPANGLFHPVLEDEIVRNGVKYLYVNRQMHYRGINGQKEEVKKYTIGQQSSQGLTYYTRNCAFEPNDENYRGLDFTLMQMDAAFRWGKPAILSTHRVNFAGGIEPRNRSKGLKELRDLLKSLVHKWPDVEFCSSRDALRIYTGI